MSNKLRMVLYPRLHNVRVSEVIVYGFYFLFIYFTHLTHSLSLLVRLFHFINKIIGTFNLT